jgi:tRNA-splicing endonuclease subunit Sen34
VDDARAHVEATPEQVAEYKAARQDDILQQQTQHRQRNEERAAAMSLIHADKIAARRAEKSQARKAQPPPSELDPPETKQTAPDPVYTVKIKGSSQGLPWYQPEAHRYDSLDAVRAAGLWDYPRTALERAKCASFEELWKRGHYMGSGLRFGGDFLVYPGPSHRPPFRAR